MFRLGNISTVMLVRLVIVEKQKMTSYTFDAKPNAWHTCELNPSVAIMKKNRMAQRGAIGICANPSG